MEITAFGQNNYITHDISSVFYLPIGQNFGDLTFGGQNFRWTIFFGGQIFGIKSKHRQFYPPKMSGNLAWISELLLIGWTGGRAD